MTVGSQLDLRHFALSVLACDAPDATPTQICGTAFAIGGGYFVTAAHVLDTVLESRAPSLGFLPDQAPLGPVAYYQAPITRHEIVRGLDLGIIACAGGPYGTFQWFGRDVALLTNVLAGGYPYALERDRLQVFVRAYRGSIASAHQIYQLPDEPGGYELSFPAPRGLSGAPLLLQQMPPIVVGYIVENGRSGMLVMSHRESIAESSSETVVEQYEYLTYGIAVSSSAVVEVQSELLGGTIKDHLKRHNLFID